MQPIKVVAEIISPILSISGFVDPEAIDDCNRDRFDFPPICRPYTLAFHNHNLRTIA